MKFSGADESNPPEGTASLDLAPDPAEEDAEEMGNDITEEEVRNDVTVFANVLFDRDMTDDPVSVVMPG